MCSLFPRSRRLSRARRGEHPLARSRLHHPGGVPRSEPGHLPSQLHQRGAVPDPWNRHRCHCPHRRHGVKVSIKETLDSCRASLEIINLYSCRLSRYTESGPKVSIKKIKNVCSCRVSLEIKNLYVLVSSLSIYRI